MLLKRLFQRPTATDWLVLGGVVVWIVAILVHQFAHVDVQRIGIAGLILAVATLIVSGLRSIRLGGFAPHPALQVFFGLAFCLSLGIMTSSASRLLLQMSHEFEGMFGPESLKPFEKILSRTDLSPEKRAAWSRLYAQQRYYVAGELIDYATPDGRTVRFQPTADDDRLRREATTMPVLLRNIITSLGNGPILWSAVAIVSIALGLVIPVPARFLAA